MHDGDGIVFDGGHVDKNIAIVDVLHRGKWEGMEDQNIVKDLLKDLSEKGLIVTTNNLFVSILLFLDLLENHIMVT